MEEKFIQIIRWLLRNSYKILIFVLLVFILIINAEILKEVYSLRSIEWQVNSLWENRYK